MEKLVFPSASRDIAKRREQLAPKTLATFRSFSRQVFAEGALPSKTKELIAVAVAHVTQMSVLHPQPCKKRTGYRRIQPRDHGSDLGGRRNEGLWCDSTLGARY